MMNLLKYKYYTLLLALLAFLPSSAGQQDFPDKLTLQQAIALGMESNFNIRIARQAEKIANNNNEKGNAGFYPTITAGVDQNNVLNNTNLTFLNGDGINVQGALSTSFQGNVALSWELFDGFRRGATLRKLQNEVQISKANTRVEAELIMSEIIKSYIALALQKKLIEFTRENLNISRARMNLAIDKERIGSASGSSVLQSKLDFNNDSLTYFNQVLQMDILRYQLLGILQINTNDSFEVDTSDVALMDKSYDLLRDDILSQNTELLLARYMIGTAEEEITELKSAQYPQLFLNSGANFSLSRNPANFVTQSVNYGPYLGLSANYTIYDGNNIRRNIDNAKVQSETRKMEYENVLLQNAIQLNNLIAQHQGFTMLESILNDNIDISKENLEIAIEQYRLGAITDVEFREIQLKSIQTNFELLQNRLEKKILEAEILRITGNLIVN